MKKIFLSFLLVSSFARLTHAQTVRFFVNKSASLASTCDCKTTDNIKVTFPVPPNVATFDSYSFYLILSSLDVPATISFDKKEIAEKLAGKKEFSAFLLKEDGSSDFYFDDVYLEVKDLCSVPRMWNITTLEIEGGSAGYKITGKYSEDVWNDYYNRWDSKTFDAWDDGEGFGSGMFSMNQAPMSDGFTDLYDIITVKAANTDSASFNLSEDLDMKGSISIVDKSQEFTTEITYATWAGGDATYNEIKANVENSIGGKFQVGPIHNFYTLRNMQEGTAFDLSGKSNYTKVSFNGIMYETISVARTDSQSENEDQQGFYATYYISRMGDYTTLIVSLTEELFELKSKGPSLMDGSEKIYHFKLSAENCKRIDTINEKWLNATSYAIPN